MGRKYGQVPETFHDGSKVRKLGERARHLRLYLSANRSIGAAGFYTLSPALVADETGLPLDQVEPALRELEAAGFVLWDGEERAVLILDHFQHVPLDSDARLKHVIDQLESGALPASPELQSRFAELVKVSGSLIIETCEEIRRFSPDKLRSWQKDLIDSFRRLDAIIQRKGQAPIRPLTGPSQPPTRGSRARAVSSTSSSPTTTTLLSSKAEIETKSAGRSASSLKAARPLPAQEQEVPSAAAEKIHGQLKKRLMSEGDLYRNLKARCQAEREKRLGRGEKAPWNASWKANDAPRMRMDLRAQLEAIRKELNRNFVPAYFLRELLAAELSTEWVPRIAEALLALRELPGWQATAPIALDSGSASDHDAAAEARRAIGETLGGETH